MQKDLGKVSLLFLVSWYSSSQTPTVGYSAPGSQPAHKRPDGKLTSTWPLKRVTSESHGLTLQQTCLPYFGLLGLPQVWGLTLDAKFIHTCSFYGCCCISVLPVFSVFSLFISRSPLWLIILYIKPPHSN